MKGFGFDGPKCAPSVFAALAVTQSTCSTMFDKTIRVILFPQSACVHLNAVFVCPILRAPELVNRIPAAGACVFSASVLSGNRFVLAFSPLEVARLLARPQPPPPPEWTPECGMWARCFHEQGIVRRTLCRCRQRQEPSDHMGKGTDRMIGYSYPPLRTGSTLRQIRPGFASPCWGRCMRCSNTWADRLTQLDFQALPPGRQRRTSLDPL